MEAVKPVYQNFLKILDSWYGIPLWMLGVSIVPFVLGNEMVEGDPLLWRANDAASFGGHHTLILMAVAFSFLWAWRRLKLTPILAGAAILYMMSWHEMEWWLTDAAWFLYNGHLGFAAGLPGELLSGYLFPVTLIVMMFYIPAVRPHWKYVAAMAVYYVGWFAIGFPVTVNFSVSSSGITQWYYVPWVNGVEILSWVYALVAFWWFGKGELTKGGSVKSSGVRPLC